MRERRIIYKTMVGNPEKKRTYGTHRSRWEDDIKMDFEGTGCEGMDWIRLVQGKF
jgi:hypothetical protein